MLLADDHVQTALSDEHGILDRHPVLHERKCSILRRVHANWRSSREVVRMVLGPNYHAPTQTHKWNNHNLKNHRLLPRHQSLHRMAVYLPAKRGRTMLDCLLKARQRLFHSSARASPCNTCPPWQKLV